MIKLQTRPNYNEYINSEKWRSRLPGFLQSANHRCSAFPWCRLERHEGKYYPYNVHHTNYKNLGSEEYWWDVLCLSKWAHDNIAHGILSFWKYPRQQDHYPNTAQVLFHAYCRLPVFAKYGTIAFLFALFGYLVAGILGVAAAVLVVIFFLS